MDRVRIELLGAEIINERRREAERERAFAMARSRRLAPAGMLAPIGRRLVRIGGRLEAIGTVPRPATPTFVPVPCGGCAD